MGSVQNINGGGGGGWLLDYGICDEVLASDFIWGSQIIDDPMISSAMLGFDAPSKEGSGLDNTCSKKRKCTGSCAAPGTKACREKLRRDKLNDRFMELCSILDPGRPPKVDKVAILGDATRRLNKLRLEAQKLKESNEALYETIKNLKAYMDIYHSHMDSEDAIKWDLLKSTVLLGCLQRMVDLRGSISSNSSTSR